MFPTLTTLVSTADLIRDSLLFVALHGIVLIAVLIDLSSGWHKAKRLGVARTSKALRKTVSKVNSYLSCLLLLSMMDVALYIVDFWTRFSMPELPYFCALGTILVLIIELRSVYENRSVNDPSLPDEDEVILSEKVQGGLEVLESALHIILRAKTKGLSEEDIQQLSRLISLIPPKNQTQDESQSQSQPQD